MFVRLGANLECDSGGGGIGIIYGLRAGLDVGAHTVVIARGKGAQVGEAVESDRVLGCRETDGSRILGDAGLSDIVGCFGTDEEAITTEHGVSGKCGALYEKEAHSARNVKGITERDKNITRTNLKDIQHCAGVEAWLLVGRAEVHRLCALVRVERGGGVELEALGDLVLELDLGAERVVGGPGLGDGETVDLVRVFALEVAGDVGRF